MCGRFSIDKRQADLEHYFGHKMPSYRGPSYNVAPSQVVPVVTSAGFENMRWGLVPQWASSLKTGYTMINAVGETLPEKRTYAEPLRSQRCIVPASGFYEWKTTAEGKQPHYIRVKSRELFGFAGLYVVRIDGEGVEMKSFTIITTTPNELVGQIHTRMPVILRPEDEAVWLNPDITDEADLMGLLRPYEAADMEMWPVGKEVGNVRNDHPELMQRVATP